MWSKSVRNLSEIEQSLAELLKILRIFADVMSCCDLDLWILYNIWAKSNNSRMSYWRFSTFSSCHFRGGGVTNCSQECVDHSNFTKFGEDIRHSYTRRLFQRWDILLHLQTQAAQIWVMLTTTQNFALFVPLWKLEEGWARYLYQLLKLYLRPNLRNTFDGHLLRGCRARWIDKKELV